MKRSKECLNKHLSTGWIAFIILLFLLRTNLDAENTSPGAILEINVSKDEIQLFAWFVVDGEGEARELLRPSPAALDVFSAGVVELLLI